MSVENTVELSENNTVTRLRRCLTAR